MHLIRSAQIWNRVCTRWTPPPSTCVFRCFPGPNSESTKPPSRCTHCWICTATSPRSSALPAAKCTTSISSTRFCRRPGRSTSWIAAMWLRAPVYLHAQRGLLWRAHQLQRLAPASLLPCSRQDHRSSIRSHCHLDRHRLRQIVPGATPPRELSRCQNQKTVQVSHQQLHASGNYHRPDLQVAVASGIVFQMDQTAFTHQGLLRYQRERGEDPNLDRGLRLRAGGDRPEALGPGDQPLPDSTDLSVMLFEKTPILQALQPLDSQNDLLDSSNQLILFDL